MSVDIVSFLKTIKIENAGILESECFACNFFTVQSALLSN
jgi:hypothetical protein